jgi:glycine/D-amino acid oxidase-like deaminating enzyme/nitrite reductase/ring-hydroxylating ferredoxin subunit
MDVLEDEIKAAHRAGLSNVEWADRAPIDKFDTGRCLRFPDQAQFHPLKYINGLAQAVRRMGGKLHTENHVATVKAENGGIRVKTDSGHVVFADAAIVATNTPINDLVVMHTKQAPYITYVIGLTAAKGEIREALFWDTGDPYHYVRLAPDPKDDEREILIVGGEDHKTGQAKDSEDRFRRLEAWARERFPMAGGVAYRWSGQVMEPVDLMGFIGPNPLDDENIYIATGDSGNGITNGTIAGILLTDLIQGRENPWESLYDPGRVTISSAGTFAKENLNVAAQYTDLVTGGEVASIDEIPNESGAIIRDGLSKLAVYRDASGRIHKLSAVCTHLGCIVAWNPGESSWDCPCHGSRFDKFGKVFQGPANSDLSPSTD